MKIVLKLPRIGRTYRYRGRSKMLKALGPDLASMTTWTAADSELHHETAGAPNPTPQGHKLAHYSKIYEAIVDRSKPLRMLVISSFYDASLQIWHECLHPDSQIIGVDPDSKLLRIRDSGGIYVRVCGGQNSSFLAQVAAEFGPFDIILDDGDHANSRMVSSFRCLFTTALSDKGVYIAEGVYRDYWKFYRDSRVSFMDLVRALTDAMHGYYQVATSETSFQDGHPNRIRKVSVPAITPILGSIEIYDSIVVVRRASRDLARSTAHH